MLLLGTEGFAHRRELERSRSAVLTRSGGRARRARFDGAAHWVFTDYAAMAPQLQAAGLMTAEARRDMVGALDPSVSVPAVRNAVRSFFARHLRA